MHAICGECGWQGACEESLDEGSAWPVVCPVCGSEELVYWSGPEGGGGSLIRPS